MLEYNLDLINGSYSQIITPDQSAKTFPFYITEYGHFKAGKKYYTIRDGKNAALLLHTISGTGDIEWHGNKCTLHPGSAVVIYCDTPHRYRTSSEKPWVFNFVHFDGTGLDGYRPLLLEHLTPVMLKGAQSMTENFRTIESAGISDGVFTWAAMSHAISGILLSMLRSLENADEPSTAFSRNEVRKLAGFIQENHTRQLTADDFVKVANISKYHLIHMFHQQMGIPPYKYMHHCRINHAQQLLRTTDTPVSEIGMQVGYPDPVNFIRQFRQITGTTPAKYRRESIQLP